MVDKEDVNRLLYSLDSMPMEDLKADLHGHAHVEGMPIDRLHKFFQYIEDFKRQYWNTMTVNQQYEFATELNELRNSETLAAGSMSSHIDELTALIDRWKELLDG